MEILLLLLLIIALLPVALYAAARSNWHATFVPEGMIKFVVQGESLKKILPNIRNQKLEGHLLTDGEEKKTFLQRTLGIYWVSALFPLRRVHSFRIDAATLRNEGERADKPAREWVHHEPRTVNGLLWRFPRPLLMKDVELKDRFQVDVVVYTIYEVIDPYIPVFVWRGKFFEQLDAAVESRALNFFNELSYEELVTGHWGKSGGIFWTHLQTINEDVENTPEGIVKAFGIEAKDSWIVFYDLSEADRETREAAKAKERAKLVAEGVREEARGEADAKETVAKAEGERGRLFIGGLLDMGVQPDVAAEIYRTQVRMEAIRDSDLTTLVEGGRALPTVPIKEE